MTSIYNEATRLSAELVVVRWGCAGGGLCELGSDAAVWGLEGHRPAARPELLRRL